MYTQWQPEHLPTDLGDDRKPVKIKRWHLTRLRGQLHDMLGILGDILADKWHAQQLLDRWPHLQSPPAQHVAFHEQSACEVQALTSIKSQSWQEDRVNCGLSKTYMFKVGKAFSMFCRLCMGVCVWQ